MLDASLDIALDFIRAHPSWYIFPITRLEKDPPHIKDNLNLASNDPKQIKMWHARWRGCNWGLALRKSNVLVMDVDRKAGKIGQQTLDTLTLEYGELPETLTVMSPSGGLHIYFAGLHRFGLGKYGFGTDVDSPNYVLIPGCWLCSNSERGYEVIKDAPVAEAPEWFGIFLKEKAEREDAPNEAAVDLDKSANIERMIRYLREGAPDCIQGQNGDKTLYDVACVLKDNGISQGKAVELLMQFYNVPGKCEPLWGLGTGPDSDRLDIKVANAYRYARENQAGTATAEYEFGGPDTITDADIAEITKYRDTWETKLMPKLRAKQAENIKTNAESKAKDVRDDPPLADPEPVDDSDFNAPPATAVTVDDSDFNPDDDPPPAGKTKKKAKIEDEDDSGAEPQAGEAPVTGKSYEDVCGEWVWVVGLERFVRITDSKMWSRAQFDSRFNHFVSVASVSANIFKTAGKMKRFDGAVFRPGQKMILPPDFNLWRPSTVTPNAGDTNLWNEHLNYLFQNPEDRDHVLNWLAWVYQNQARKPNHALLIVGKNTGTGKSFIARVMEQLMGRENTQRPKNSSLKGDFNGWAQRCKFCIIEELMQIGRREVANELRDIITEPTIEVNIKNVPAHLVENSMAMMGISNHPDALPIDDTDRRWLVVSTKVYRKDPEYYRRLFTILDSPAALAAIAHELNTRELGDYDASQAAPDTDAKQQMIQLSRSDAEQWLFDNMGNAPLSHNLVTVQDIIEAMTPTMQRTARLHTIVQNFMMERLKAEPLGQIRVNSGKRVRLWGLHGRAGMILQADQAKIAEMYEAERKQTGGATDEQAMADFGPGGD